MKMSLKNQIRGNQNEIIVSLEGHLNFETTDSLRKNLSQLEEKSGTSKIIFDFSELQFVGSSGISAFIQALREFNSKAATKPGYTNVKSEFKKIITAFDEEGSFEFLEPGYRNYPLNN